jgi:hypothetical protein
MQEAQDAWLREAEKRRARALEHRQTSLPVESSWDTERIAVFNRHKDVFPWVCLAIVRKGHFDVMKLPAFANERSQHAVQAANLPRTS